MKVKSSHTIKKNWFCFQLIVPTYELKIIFFTSSCEVRATKTRYCQRCCTFKWTRWLLGWWHLFRIVFMMEAHEREQIKACEETLTTFHPIILWFPFASVEVRTTLNVYCQLILSFSSRLLWKKRKFAHIYSSTYFTVTTL